MYLQTEKYEYLPGMEALLSHLRGLGYQMHVVSNYPEWYKLIEDKLEISRFMPWTFLSCEGPMQVVSPPLSLMLSHIWSN
jgi:FMN hydrolase / 5-amino-6-(5-phospho-D-ribitylamino)uracil phosphatase